MKYYERAMGDARVAVRLDSLGLFISVITLIHSYFCNNYYSCPHFTHSFKGMDKYSNRYWRIHTSDELGGVVLVEYFRSSFGGWEGEKERKGEGEEGKEEEGKDEGKEGEKEGGEKEQGEKEEGEKEGEGGEKEGGEKEEEEEEEEEEAVGGRFPETEDPVEWKVFSFSFFVFRHKKKHFFLNDTI